MSSPKLLQNSFASGMRRDSARNRMAPDSAWTLRDIILEYGAPARERAGWGNAAPSITSVTAGTAASSIKGGLYAVYSPTAGAVARNICVDEDGKAYKITESAVTYLGTGVTVLQNPVFHGGAAASAATAVYTGLAIIPDATAANGPYKYDGTTLSALNGTPPKARYATIYKDYTVLANGKVGSTEFPNRVWFSPPGDPDCFGTAGITAWDTTDSWIDFTVPVKGLAATNNVILVFGDEQVARIRGSAAPPDTDMTVDDPWLKVGLLDARSITPYQDTVFWCAPEGIFRTDGVSLDDLTLKGGMLRYWLDIVADADDNYTFATGILRNKLIVVVLDSGTFVDGFMIDLQSYAWVQLTNVDAYTFWSGRLDSSKADETFFGRAGAPRVGNLSTMFTEMANSSYVSDGDGTTVTSYIESPFFEVGSPGWKIWKSIYIGFSLTDLSGANPSIAVGYIDTPEDTTYTSLGTLTETSNYQRLDLYIGGRHYGIALEFDRAGAGDFYGYDLMADVRQLEGSRV